MPCMFSVHEQKILDDLHSKPNSISVAKPTFWAQCMNEHGAYIPHGWNIMTDDIQKVRLHELVIPPGSKLCIYTFCMEEGDMDDNPRYHEAQ